MRFFCLLSLKFRWDGDGEGACGELCIRVWNMISTPFVLPPPPPPQPFPHSYPRPYAHTQPSPLEPVFRPSPCTLVSPSPCACTLVFHPHPPSAYPCRHMAGTALFISRRRGHREGPKSGVRTDVCLYLSSTAYTPFPRLLISCFCASSWPEMTSENSLR